MARKRKQPGFEERLKQLEGIVHKLEEGNLPLEESLGLFEQGIALSRELQREMEAASLRVSKLLENGQEAPFEERGSANAPDAASANGPALEDEAIHHARSGSGDMDRGPK